MLTILEQSVKGKLKNFRTISWRSSNQISNTLTETFWVFRTPHRKFTLIEYLQMKELLIGLPKLEQRALFDAPGVLTDELFIAALKAKIFGVPTKTLWQRLRLLQKLLGRQPWEPNLVYTLDGCFIYELEETRKSIRKVKKYSGFVRNASAVGSKRKSTSTKPEPESFEWNTNIELDYFNFLSVGEFNSGLPGIVFLPDESKRRRNGNPIK